MLSRVLGKSDRSRYPETLRNQDPLPQGRLPKEPQKSVIVEADLHHLTPEGVAHPLLLTYWGEPLEDYDDEVVCHPHGCEVVEVRFHDQALVKFLQKSPLAERMEIPSPHLQPRVGGPAWKTRKRKL